MNKKIGIYSSLANLLFVFIFAVSMIFNNSFISYLSSIFISLTFILISCAYCFYCNEDRKIAGYISIIFSGIYSVFIFIIYFAQLTTVRIAELDYQAIQLLDYQKFGLFFNYNLFGYGMMALSTFFIGLTIENKNKINIWLKRLLLIHGVFFISGLIIPMLGIFNADLPGADLIGVIILEIWCIYFSFISLLSFLYFKNK